MATATDTKKFYRATCYGMVFDYDLDTPFARVLQHASKVMGADTTDVTVRLVNPDTWTSEVVTEDVR